VGETEVFRSANSQGFALLIILKDFALYFALYIKWNYYFALSRITAKI